VQFYIILNSFNLTLLLSAVKFSCCYFCIFQLLLCKSYCLMLNPVVQMSDNCWVIAVFDHLSTGMLEINEAVS